MALLILSTGSDFSSYPIPIETGVLRKMLRASVVHPSAVLGSQALQDETSPNCWAAQLPFIQFAQESLLSCHHTQLIHLDFRSFKET